MTLFDHLNNIYLKKTDWNTLSEADKKTWNAFMVNKYVSMLGADECILANAVQQYKLEPKLQYDLYKSMFPVKKRHATYIKGNKEEKFNADLVKVLATHYEISRREAEEYIGIIPTVEIVSILEGYGFESKEIKKIMK